MHRYPLYGLDDVRDACGVGFIADRRARASNRLLRLAVECLHNLDHRGALSADGTGDGAGIMTRLPYRILERDLRANDLDVPSRMALGLVMVFLPQGDAAAGRQIVEDAISQGGDPTAHVASGPGGAHGALRDRPRDGSDHHPSDRRRSR